MKILKKEDLISQVPTFIIKSERYSDAKSGALFQIQKMGEWKSEIHSPTEIYLFYIHISAPLTP